MGYAWCIAAPNKGLLLVVAAYARKYDNSKAHILRSKRLNFQAFVQGLGGVSIFVAFRARLSPGKRAEFALRHQRWGKLTYYFGLVACVVCLIKPDDHPLH